MGCPVQFFHNLDDTQPTTRLLKNATRFSRLSSWLTLQTNSQDIFPQDSAILPTGINSDHYDERRHFVIFNGWQQITLRSYTELDTLQKIGTTRPFIPPLATRTPPGRRMPPAQHPGLVSNDRPHPLFTAPPQKSHVIRLPENSTPPTNVAIPTVWFQSLKGLHGIMCDISEQPHRHPDAARPTPRPRTRRPPTPRPGLAHTPLHRPPQKSHVIRLPENSAPPTNVAIPTAWFQSLKGLHGIMCDIFRQPRPTVPAHANTPTRQHMPTTEPQGTRHPAQASSHASARPTPRPRPHPPSPPHPKSRT